MDGMIMRWLGILTLALCSAVSSVGAVEYQLQVANLDEQLFLRYVEYRGTPFNTARHELPQLEKLLDSAELSRYVILPYEARPVPAAQATLVHWEPAEARIALPGRESHWTVLTWDGAPEQTTAFEISSFRADYQELTAVAVNTNGVLKRLPVYDVSLLNGQKLLAPALSSVYIDHAFERGTFGTWVAQRAASLDGLSVIIGRNHDPQYPDRLYLVVRMPPEARTYKVVLGWKDREEFRQDGSDNDAGDRDG